MDLDFLHSDKIPPVDYRPPISDLFRFFGVNWYTLSPVLTLLFGILIGFFLLGLLIKLYKTD